MGGGQIFADFSDFLGRLQPSRNYHPEDSRDSGSSTQQSLLLAFIISDLQDPSASQILRDLLEVLGGLPRQRDSEIAYFSSFSAVYTSNERP